MGCGLKIVPNFDRNLPDSPAPSLPLDRLAMCRLHAQTRITTELLNLKIDRILSQANINAQGGNVLAKDNFVHNLEDNIDMRGVRQGNVRVLFDKQGQPIAIQPAFGCYNSWANLRCSDCLPLGENYYETGLLQRVSLFQYRKFVKC